MQKKTPCLLHLRAGLLALCAGVCAAAWGLTLENDAMQLQFRDAAGMGLTGVVNKVAGGVCFGASTGDIDFWQIFLARPGAFTPVRDVRGGDFVEIEVSNRSPTRRAYSRRDGAKTVFAWEGIDLRTREAGVVETNAVDVYATVELLPGRGESRWTLDVVNRSRTYALTRTRYPVIKRAGPRGETDMLQPRSNLGAGLVRRHAPEGNPKAVRSAGYMGYQPQVLAYMRDGAGLYFAAHDPEGRIKRIAWDGENSCWFYTPVENAGVPGKAAGSPKYPVVLDVFAGDWWGAARLYKRWALKQKWASKGPIAFRSDYPRTMSETPLWINIHGDSSVASNVLTRAHELFPDFATGLHWHRWNFWGHDSHYPEYFPTVPGVKEALSYLGPTGQRAMIYTNGRLWDADIPSWEVARPWGVMRPCGTNNIERYGNKRAQGVMCPYTGFWQDTMAGLADRITGELGAPGLFMDQIGAAAPRPCHNPLHGHTLGGGTYWFDGYQRLLERAHAITSARGAFLTTEGTAETWMNNVDGYLCVTLFKGDDVPFYPAVYSGYTTYFCSPQASKDTVDAFWALQASQFLAGVAMGWFEPAFILDEKSPVIAEKRALAARLCRARQEWRDYLAYGELLDEVRPLDPLPEIEVVWNGRWVRNAKPVTARMPSVIGAVWRDRRTDARAAFLVNLAQEERTVRFRAPCGKEISRTLAPRALERIVFDSQQENKTR